MFVLSGVGHIAISCALGPTWRARWQTTTIILNGIAVWHNYVVGVRVTY